MSVTVAIPKDYAFVAVAAISTGFLTVWQSLIVSKWRRKAGIKYPQTYAEVAQQKESENALKFNCAQRAHANTLEHLSPVLASLLYTGIFYPRTAAAMGAMFVIGRVFYTLGYITGNPKGRYRGSWNQLGEGGLYFLGLYASWKLYTGDL